MTEFHPVKDRIIDLAFQAFHQQGFKSVSMDLVAGKLRISKKTIYKHFSSKEELLEAGIQKEFDSFVTRLKQIGRPKGAFEDFEQIGQVYTEFLQMFNPTFRNELRRDLPFIEERISMYEGQTFKKPFSRVAKDLRNRAKIAYPIPTKELTTAFLAMVRGISELPDSHRNLVISTFVNGMRVGKPKKKK